MACPGCRASLNWVVWLDVGRFVCKGCDGVWMPHDQLGELGRKLGIRISVTSSDHTPRDAPRACPQCGDAMGEHGDAVRIDVCPAHGTFYDRGELAAILAPLIESGLKESAT